MTAIETARQRIASFGTRQFRSREFMDIRGYAVILNKLMERGEIERVHGATYRVKREVLPGWRDVWPEMFGRQHG